MIRTSPEEGLLPGDKPDTIRNTPIRDIPKLTPPIGQLITSEEDIPTFVEKPLIAACTILFQRGLCTTASSANADNIPGGYAYINIDPKHLSDGNREIARRLSREHPTQNGGARQQEIAITLDETDLQIRIPLKDSSTWEDVENASLSVAEQFGEQAATWVPSFTLHELNEVSGTTKDPMTKDDYVSGGLYYDDESQRFYQSRRLYELAKREK